MLLHCKNEQCLHNSHNEFPGNHSCKRSYVILDVMGMCEVFVAKIEDAKEPTNQQEQVPPLLNLTCPTCGKPIDKDLIANP